MRRLLLLIIVLLAGSMALQAQSVEKNQSEKKYSFVLDLIDRYYMDSTDLPKLTETAIRAMLKELDPHSVYIPKNEVEKMNEPLIGSFDGVGISYQIFHDTILVISPTPGGPSEKVGLQAGDKIVRINGEESTGKKVDEAYVFSKLRGKKGSEVVLGISRYGNDSILMYTVVRDKIPINTVTAAFMQDSKTGYIRLSRFSSSSAKEFHDATKKLKKEGMENLVFDLRGNSGGYMNAAIDIADEFLSGDKLIVYTKGIRSPRLEYTSSGKDLLTEGRLVLLIDEGSASASEIVAGALQDWDRALLIGRRSYGKGLVQKPYYLPDGSQVRLTTARYYTPSGRCIQRPYDQGTEKYFKEFNRRIKHGELVNADSIKLADSLMYTTPAGRVVYGGGGIMPDIFMAVDSAYYSPYFNELLRKGILNEFCLQYVDNNRRALKAKFTEPTAFLNDFIVNEELIENLIAFAETKGLKRNEEQIAKSYTYLSYQVKAFIGRNFYNIQVYQQVMAGVDQVIQKALEVITSGQEFRKLSMK